jgi:hypothetical protein
MRYAITSLVLAALACSADPDSCDPTSLAHLKDRVCGDTPWSDSSVPTLRAETAELYALCLEAQANTAAQGQDIVYCDAPWFPPSQGFWFELRRGPVATPGALSVETVTDLEALITSYWDSL